jgi:hypothetical protein
VDSSKLHKQSTASSLKLSATSEEAAEKVHSKQSMDMKHGHEAWTWSMDKCTPYSRPLLSPSQSGFGLWNRISRVMWQREEKARNCGFSTEYTFCWY